jgi:serine/threonine protein kinase
MAWSQTLLAGRWRLGPKLGSGGQGHTYLARDEKDLGPGERLVAIKELKLGEAGWKRFDLFEREARVLAKLRHPGIPRYLDRLEGDKGTFYLVMEQAPGESLRALAARRRFSEDEIRDIADQLLGILEYLHGMDPPVVHRDIKPANVLRARDGRVSLVDFGGVRDALRDDGEGGSTMVGTFGYMAPEQLHGEATPRTDLYALGATLVALCGGIEPEKVPRKGLKMDLGKRLRGVSPDLRKLVERLVEPDADKRPASADEARRLLRGGKKRPETVRQPEPEPEPEPELEPEPEPESRVSSEWVRELDELALPRPLKFLFRVFFGLVGLGGHLALSLVAILIVPLVFSVARAVSGKERDEKLRLTEGRVQSVLKDTRRDFRALQRHAFSRASTPRLAPRRDVPRLPRRR